MDLNSDGITSAGAISGVTTLDASGDITTSGHVYAAQSITAGSALHVSGAAESTSTPTGSPTRAR